MGDLTRAAKASVNSGAFYCVKFLDAMASAIYIAMADEEETTMTKEAMKNRTIRTTDSQWAAYKLLLGDDWFRDQIAKAEKKANKPAAHTTTKE